jgi:hypothetical protein
MGSHIKSASACGSTRMNHEGGGVGCGWGDGWVDGWQTALVATGASSGDDGGGDDKGISTHLKEGFGGWMETFSGGWMG